MSLLLLAALAASNPLPADFAARPQAWEALQTRLSADGSAVAYREQGPDGQARVVAWAVAEGGERQVFPLPPDQPVAGPYFAGDEAFVLLGRGQEASRATWAGAGWQLGQPSSRSRKGAPAAPDTWTEWAQEGGKTRFTVWQGDEARGSWTLTLKTEDRVLFDASGWPRAVVRAAGRRERLRPLPGDPPTPWPAFVPKPDPGPGPLRRRVLSRPVAFAEERLWALDGRDLPHVALVSFDERGERSIALEVPDADLLQVSLHPDRGVPDLALAYRALPRWVSAVPEAQADLDWVADALPGTVWRIDRARGDRRWHACGVAPDAPVRCAWFDRDARRVVFTREEPLTAAPGPLPRTIPVVLPTSDGLALDSYLVLPPGVSDPPAEPLPAVVLLHGGPYARTTYEPDPLRAYLASRGLAVLDLNFRGSTGQGVEVLTGADGERGLATQRDVREASAWLVDQGVADPRRLALMGHSFGGYSTLLGLAQEPGRYRCGVALAPMAGWSYRWLLWLLPRRQRERLPTTQLEQLVDPVFLAHAADDRVLPVGESRHVARALTRLGRPVTYLELDQGGHDLAAHADALGVAAADFLSACLGDDPAWAPAAAGDTPRP